MSLPTTLLIIALFAPLAAAFISMLLRRTGYEATALLSTSASGLSLVASLALAATVLGGEALSVDAPWMKGLALDAGQVFYVDELGVFFIVVAAFFGLMAILYSYGDMSEEKAYSRYYTLMLLFQSSMIGLFSSGSLLLIIVFWELVAICSYGLIGFYKEKKDSMKASYKALMITRICGTGLIVAVLILLVLKSFNYGEALSITALLGSTDGKILLVLPAILVASMAKSVQFPFHTWLPDATVAPSAVTAYLHAAAMVKAGVYLIARFYHIISPEFIGEGIHFIAIAAVGAVTLTICTMAAWMQDDVKRVLAYHTCGQIGYMFLGLGIGTSLGVSGALLHFLNHAIFKGLLFLGAGCLIYVAGTKNLNKMGGLARKMPVTAAAMVIGSLSIIGIPPFSGFASKFLLYEAAFERASTFMGGLGAIYFIFFILAVFTSAVTLASFTKVLHAAFFGALPKRLEKVRRVPLSMQVPLITLSGLCVFLGFAPQTVMAWAVNPILKAIGLQPVSIGFFGLRTAVGWYETSTLAIVIAASIVLGLVVYKLTARSHRGGKAKRGLFLGGEAEPPYIDGARLRVDAKPFTFSPLLAFSRPYQFMKSGGLDVFYYGLARFVERWAIPLFAVTAAIWAAALALQAFPPQLYVGLFIMLGGALFAATRSNTRHMLLFLALSQLGFIALEFGFAGLPGITGEYAAHGVAGGVLHLLNFVFFITVLFTCLWAVKSKTGVEDAGGLGGLSSVMPVAAAAFLVAAFSMSGLPPLGGWWSEYYLLSTAAQIGRWDLVFAASAASIITLAVTLRAFHRIFLGEPRGWKAGLKENWVVAAVLAALACIIILLGVYPDPFLSFACRVAGGLI